MFAFSQIQPETTGSVQDMAVPISDYLSTNAEEAIHLSPVAETYRWSELYFAKNNDQPQISAEQANKIYSVGDLKFDEPITEEAAQLLHDRKQAEMDRAFTLSNDNHDVLSKVAGMTTGMVASMIDPVNLALMFVPFVGEAPMLGPVTDLAMLGRGAAVREALSRGIIDRAALQSMPFPKFAESIIQGAGFMTLAEIPKQIGAASEHQDVGNPLVNILEGTAMAGAMHFGISALARAWQASNAGTKMALLLKGMDDFAQGRDINVADLAKTDENFVRFALDHEAIGTEGEWPVTKTEKDFLTGPEADIQNRQLYENRIKSIFQDAINKLQKEYPVRKGKTPVIPETGVEPERVNYTSQLDEIRKNGANTTAKVQALFPKAELTRQQAAVLRRAAWGEQEVKTQTQANIKEVLDTAQKETQKPKAQPRDERGRFVSFKNVEEQAHKEVPEDSTIAKVQKQTQEITQKVTPPKSESKQPKDFVAPTGHVDTVNLKGADLEIALGESVNKLNERLDKGRSVKMYGGLFLLDPDFWVNNFGPDSFVQYEAKQIYNTMRNKLGPDSATWKMVDSAAFRAYMTGKKTIDDVGNWIHQNGQKVLTYVYSMEGKVSEAKKEYDKMTHEWYETLTHKEKQMMDSYAYTDENTGDMIGNRPILQHKELTMKEAGMDVEQAKKYKQLQRQVENEPRDTSPRATSYYNTVSALPTNEPMPDWTATKSGKNVQRVDVVIPQKDFQGSMADLVSGKGVLGKGRAKEDVLWQPDNLHENLPNTLGWSMIQYKTGPKGEKIAVIAEAQSRWGQEQRAGKQEYIDKGLKSGKKTREQLSKEYDEKPTFPDHPLLRDYNRLILKAAIDQARKEGATHIMVSDAETAMMTEGHDNIRDTPGIGEGDMSELGMTPDDMIEQAPGMRLNYDTILPKIAEELTGSKGERVSLGEHKNAMEVPKIGTPEYENENVKSVPRSNLIFRNLDGTPKTDVSGQMYDIKHAREDFTFAGKDKAIMNQIEKAKEIKPQPEVIKAAIKCAGEQMI